MQLVTDPISYRVDDNDKLIVTYTAPIRKFGNLREELLNDAKSISNRFGHVYVALSSGIDSQTIVRSFIDAGADFTPFFVYSAPFNDNEYCQILECEKFYGIKVKIIPIDVLSKKDDWMQRKELDKVQTLTHYNMVDACKQLEGNDPIVMCGPELHILGNKKLGPICASHNCYKADNLRFREIRKFRTLIDWPSSPESLASLYCDDLIKVFMDTKEFFDGNNFIHSSGDILRPSQSFNNYVKPLLKGKYFKKDILYFPKSTGYENFPDWIIKGRIEGRPPIRYDVTVKMIDAINHLSLCDGSQVSYSDFHYRDH